MNARRQRRGPAASSDEHSSKDRWLVSYADFITLLFGFFVVMYAISSVNEGKYRVLSDTMVAAFNTPPKSLEPVQVGKPIENFAPQPDALGVPKPIHLEPPKPVELPSQHMIKIAEQLTASLKPLIDKDLIKVNRNNLWVEVEINTSILFSSGSADMEEEAFAPLSKLAMVIKDLPNYVDVEGHTDNFPIKNAVYPSNWELSAARAASVVHLFVKQGVAPERLSAIGYGEYRPIGDNNSIDGRRANRRVRVVILADKNARRVARIEGQENSINATPAAASP
ncbi:MAG: flagellar motor protein MotD [Gammaproteobacteria bacterium]|nr:flagellar motor protein MotD [Gammaproteobacteria bacterium]